VTKAYTDSQVVGKNYIFICSHNGDDNTLRWNPGFISIPAGGTYYSSSNTTSWGGSSTLTYTQNDISGGAYDISPSDINKVLLYYNSSGDTSYLTLPTSVPNGSTITIKNIDNNGDNTGNGAAFVIQYTTGDYGVNNYTLNPTNTFRGMYVTSAVPVSGSSGWINIT